MTETPGPGQDYGLQFVNPYAQQDGPISGLFRKDDMLRIIQEYLEDKKIPEEHKVKFWGIYSKFLALTFFTREDIEEIRILADNSQLIDIMSMPPASYTWDKMQFYEQLNIFLLAQIKRSIGTNQGTINERTLENTQINQMINTPTPAAQGAGGVKGFFNKIFG